MTDVSSCIIFLLSSGFNGPHDIVIHRQRVVEWLKRRARDQHGLGSKPTRAILLCPWERRFTALSPGWWSWKAVLNFNHISNFNRIVISWHL